MRVMGQKKLQGGGGGLLRVKIVLIFQRILYQDNYISSRNLINIPTLRFSDCCPLGLGALTVERSFFPENERNDQERSHRSEKKNA